MLAPGTRLGSYEVVSLLGAGGMGEVYKARDVRLGRSVALKVLHADVATDPRVRERFEREGRAVSSLNHPRICTLYDVSHHDGVEFLVMEFVEGQTLAERLAKGPLPIDTAVRIAIEMAEALDHAHRRGITHRDLKPPNVMLTAAGVKLLDFGVAKLRDAGVVASRSLDRAVAALDSSATAVPLTDEGMLLGTFEYMAPEQLQGQDADERADVFAFGAVLYEMLTGRRAFASTTPAGAIGAVMMASPPPIRDIRPVSPLLDRIVSQCLAKNPDDRWQRVRDVQPPLQWVLDRIDAVAPAPAAPPRKNWYAIAAFAALVLAAGALPMWLTSSSASDIAPDRWDVAAPVGESFAADVFPSIAVSPDGRDIAFRSQSGGTTRLYLRRSGSFESVAVPGSEGAHSPFFSPNGQWVGFLQDSNLYKASVAGGAPVFITSAPSVSPTSPGVTWGEDGTIVFAAGASGLMRVRDTGGAPAVLTTPDKSRGEVTHIAPQFIAGRREVLFSIRTTTDQWRVGLLSLDTGKWDWLPPLGQIAGVTYVADTNHLVYAQERKLFAIPVDLASRTFPGSVVAFPEDVYTHVVGGSMVAQFALSANGVLAFMAGEPENRMLVRVDRARTERQITDEPHGFRYPRLSPNEDLVTVTIEDARSDVAVVDTARGTVRRLTKSGAATTPAFTRDGLKVAFSWLRPGADSYDIFAVPVDDSAAPEPLLVGRPGGQFVSDWAPQGDDAFAFYELTNETSRDIWTWSVKGRAATKIAATPLNESAASFSRQGTWLAFVSNETGGRQSRVYVQRYPGTGRPQVVSPPGGTEPVWSPTTDELFYRLGNRIMAVPFDPATGTTVGEAAAVVEGAYVPAPSESGRPNYDVARDGSFVMVRSLERSATHLHVVQRWFEELRAMSR